MASSPISMASERSKAGAGGRRRSYQRGVPDGAPSPHAMRDDTVETAPATTRQSDDRYRALVESATDAIVSADAEGRNISWNRAAERVFGYAADEILGRRLTSLMPEQYREQHERGMRRFLSSGEGRAIGQTVELEGLRRDGTTFPVELALSTWTTGDGRFFTGIVRDITERRMAQEK